jgi:hypothetical protein
VTVRGTIIRVVVQLLTGGVIGGILGSIFTGDWIYTIVWATGLPVVLTIAGMLGGRGAKARVLTAPGRVPGIISSVHPRPVPTQTVLNPESSGTVLNGSTVVPPTAAPTPQPPGQVPRWSRAAAILIVLLGAALALIPAYRMIGWTAANLVQGRWDGNDMRVGLRQQEAIDDIAAVVGSYEFTSVAFYDSYVLVDAPTRPGATTTDQYEWRYGRASRDGAASGSLDGLFDARGIDFSIIGDLVAAAKADTGWQDFTSLYPAVRADGDGVPEVTISLGNDYYSGSYTYSIEGELLDRYGDGLD